MKQLLIVQNITREKPGLLEAVLAERNISYELVDLDKGEAFPSPLDYQALIVLGGPDSANDTTGKMTQELAQVKIALDNKKPYLGICLGLQVGVKAGGGTIVPSPHKEVGFIDPDGGPFTVQLTDAGKHDPLFADLTDELKVFHLHGETVELTDDMVLLASGAWCKNQIIKIGESAYGIQSHFEQTEAMLRVLAAEDPDLIPLGAEVLLAAYKAIEAEYTRTGQTLFRNFLDIAGLH